MIQFQQVNKVFAARKKSVQALKDVSFEVRKGEIFGLLGPNGAGKTTALRILSTLLVPTRGKVGVCGYDTQKDSQQVRKRVGFLSSDMSLTGNMTSRETLRFFGELNHLEKGTIENQITNLSQYLGMKDFLDRRMGTYSQGMKQKTLIAIALIHSPDIIVFDEPTNGLDILTARTVLDYLKDLQSQGKTIILSTHVMEVARKMCDRIGIIDHGMLKIIGTLPEILEKTQTDDLEDAFFSIVKEGDAA